MRPNLITRLKEEWNNLDPVDPLRGLIADAIDALAEAQPSKPLTDEQSEDAARYAFLVNTFGVTKLPCFLEREIGRGYIADGKVSIDAAIDAAIEAARGIKGQP